MTSPRKTRKKAAKTTSSPPPAIEPEGETVYSLEVMVGLTGMPAQSILEYEAHGLIVPIAAGGPDQRQFDDEALRTLRRLEHLRTRYEMNLRGLKLILGLLREREHLEAGLRRQR